MKTTLFSFLFLAAFFTDLPFSAAHPVTTQCSKDGSMLRTTPSASLENAQKKFYHDLLQPYQEEEPGQAIGPQQQAVCRTNKDFSTLLLEWTQAQAPSSWDELGKSLQKTGYCPIFYPYDTPYRYAMGSRRDDSATPPKLNLCTGLTELIEDAIRHGTDPYAALAVATMESPGIDDSSTLYLDPLPWIQTLGCTYQIVPKAQSNLVSYGTPIQLPTQTIPAPAWLLETKAKLASTDIRIAHQPSFFCIDPQQPREPHWIEASAKRPEGCCVEMPFSPDSPTPKQSRKFQKILNRAGTFHHLNQAFASGAKKAPSTRIEDSLPFAFQGFNGFAISMGNTEPVAAWRSGINHFSHPEYGLHASVYYTQSLLPNPIIRQLIEQAESKLQKKSVSLLCSKYPGQTLTLDSDPWLNRAANATRFARVATLPIHSLIWSTLLPEEQATLTGELRFVVNDPNLQSKLPPAFLKQVQILRQKEPSADPHQWSIAAKNSLLQAYFKDLYPARKALRSASQMQYGYTWGPLPAQEYRQTIRHIQQQLYWDRY